MGRSLWISVENEVCDLKGGGLPLGRRMQSNISSTEIHRDRPLYMYAFMAMEVASGQMDGPFTVPKHIPFLVAISAHPPQPG